MTRLNQSNRGRPLETPVVASQGHVVRVDKYDAQARVMTGGAVKRVKGPVDFVGEVIATGRAIHFDAKRTALKGRFDLALIEPHQLDHLSRHGRAGAIAGVLVHCYAPAVDAYFWFPVYAIERAGAARLASMPWDAPGVTRLGPGTHLIPFHAVPAVAAEIIIGDRVRELRKGANEAAGRSIDDPDQLPLFLGANTLPRISQSNVVNFPR